MSVNSLFKPNEYTVYAGKFIGPIMGPIDTGAIAYSGVNPSNPNQLVIKALSTGTIGETHAELKVVDNSGFVFSTPLGAALQGNKIVADPTGIAITTTSLSLNTLPFDNGTAVYSIHADVTGKLFKRPNYGYSVSSNIGVVDPNAATIIDDLVDGAPGQYINGLIPNPSNGGIVPTIAGIYQISATVQLINGLAGDRIELKFLEIGQPPLIEADTILAVGGEGEISFSVPKGLEVGHTYVYQIVTPAGGVNSVEIAPYPANSFSGGYISPVEPP